MSRERTLNGGDLRDYHGYRVHAEGWVEQKRRPGAYLLPEEVKGGYLRVRIALEDGNARRVLIHVLIAELFIGPKPGGCEVNHKDGDKRNNAVENLEYVTPRENVRHSIDVLGTTRAPGSRNGNARLTESSVTQMRADYRDGLTAAEVAAKYETTYGHAWRIVTGRAWRHVA